MTCGVVFGVVALLVSACVYFALICTGKVQGAAGKPRGKRQHWPDSRKPR